MSTTKRVTRAQRRIVSESEDIQKVEKNETESHPAQAEEDISGGNVEELLVPDEMVEFMSAKYPEDTDKGGQEEGTSFINQEPPADLPDKPRKNSQGEEDSIKSREDPAVFSSEAKWDSKVEITPIPEDTGRGGQEEGTSSIINQESSTDMPGQLREEIPREQDSAKSQADQEVVHSQEKAVPEDTDRDGQESPADVPDKPRENPEEDGGKSEADLVLVHSQEKPDSEMESTAILEDIDRDGLVEGSSCTTNQESPTDLPEKPGGEENSGKSEAEPVVVHSQEKPDSEMEDAPIPDDTDRGDQEEETSSTIDQESPEDLPEKPAMEELFDPKWVDLIQLLQEKSDPEVELKEKDHQVGSMTHKFLYPVPMLPLADSVKQQWEEVNRDLTEDTSKIVPVRKEDEKRFWTNNSDYRKYCQSSTIDDDYCTEVANEIRARQAYRGSFIKKSFAIQDPLLHTCENSFKKCDESARMMIQASSHAVLMLNAVENILKTCPSERQSDALLMIEGIQGALECIANTSARVVARTTISRRTICMSQIHHNKPESIKKILTLPMDTKDLFHGEFQKMLDKKPRAKKRKLQPSSDNSPKSSEEPSPIKRKLQLDKPGHSNKKSNAKDRKQPPFDNRPNKANAKKRRPSHGDPRSDHQRQTFDDRDPYGGSYGPSQFPPYHREHVPPYSHGHAPQYPHGHAPHYPHEHLPQYPHERAPPYPNEQGGSYPYDYDHDSQYPREHDDYNQGYHFGGLGPGRFPQQGGSNFSGQKIITQEGMNKNAQERIRERLNQKGHS